MRGLGIAMLLGGLLWASIGLYQGCGSFAELVKNEQQAEADGTAVAISWILNGAVFVFPGMVIAGIGALVSRSGRKQSASEPRAAAMTGEKRNDDEKACPFCAERIKAAAVVCRFCSRELPAA